MLLESRSDGNPSNPANPWDPKHLRCCWNLVRVEIPAIPQTPGIPSIPLLLESRSGGNPSNPSNPWDRKHPRCCRDLVQVEIPAIAEIAKFPAIAKIAIFFVNLGLEPKQIANSLDIPKSHLVGKLIKTHDIMYMLRELDRAASASIFGCGCIWVAELYHSQHHARSM
jgi:hypothetical protein